MEIWKDIPEYEGIYEASTLGRIRSCQGKSTSNARFDKRVWKQRYIKYQCSGKNNRRDYRVKLWKDNDYKTHLVSRIIAKTFVDGYFDGATVNHINGNPLDNRAENLEWVTRQKNIALAFENGLYPQHKTTLIDESGKELTFISSASACRFLGRNDGYICGVKHRNRNVVYSVDGRKYTYIC